LISDLRLLDIVLWTSQDDRLSQEKGQRQKWRDGTPGPRLPLDDYGPSDIGSQ
jgi:hypothetical protein